MKQELNCVPPNSGLQGDPNSDPHVYGFNGKHLGWFARGVIRDHAGNGACAVREVLTLTEIEPIKSIKEIKPIKSIKEIAPIRPIFSISWSRTPCSLFLQFGRS